MQINENRDAKLSWSALEYESKDRSRDWFWALGIIMITSSLASIIFGNYFFAVLIILGGLLLGFFALKDPNLINYELNNSGLKIDTRLYPYEKIKSFWVQAESLLKESSGVEIKPILFIKTERSFMPILSVPIEDSLAEEIYSIFEEKNIEKEEMKEHPSEKIMDALGF